MATNYLHDFTKILDGAIEKYDGISTAINLEDPSKFSQQENYKEKVLGFRKEIRTKKIIKITDIFNLIEEFVDEETLSLYSIEKSFNFVKKYKNSKPIIKSIMNKFDKHIRTSINKDILSPFCITAKVQRKSVWGDEYLDKLMVKDKRKTNTPTNRYRLPDDETSKIPAWDIQIKIPLPSINVTNTNQDFNVDIPMTMLDATGVVPSITLNVSYQFKPLSKFFVENINKINDYKKDINLFIVDLMKHSERQMSFANNVRKRYDSANGHPYISDSGSWCPGDYERSLNRAFSAMDITLLATIVQKWMSNYVVGYTNPHRDIMSFYEWLPEDLGTNPGLLPFRQSMGRSCWGKHESTDVCKARKCVFINICDVHIANKSNEEATEATESVDATNNSVILPNLTDAERRENLLVADNMGLSELRQNHSEEIFSIANKPNNTNIINFLYECNAGRASYEGSIESFVEETYLSMRGSSEEDIINLYEEIPECVMLPIINHTPSLFSIG